MDRYFPATALGGRLYWDDSRLSLQDEAVVDTFVNPRFGHWKVRTTEKLAEVVKASERGLPAISVEGTCVHVILARRALRHAPATHPPTPPAVIPASRPARGTDRLAMGREGGRPAA